jgi:hypothetical protein
LTTALNAKVFLICLPTLARKRGENFAAFAERVFFEINGRVDFAANWLSR